MNAKDSLTMLQHNVQRMIKAISMLEDNYWIDEAKKRLIRLDRRLSSLPLSPSPALNRRLAMEFYSIIESHSRLRQASGCVFMEEIIDICKCGLEYYAQLASERSLTSFEIDQFRTVENEHLEATKELDRLWQELSDNA